jgi:aryl-alcohol dehydrogenase-like predicted oxidoreductase
MPTRNLGRTGYQTGLFSLGGQAAIEKADNEAVAVPLIEKALDIGVNYMDTSARYGGDARWSERYIGQVVKRRRREVFLATKTHDRTLDGSMRLLEKSLELLQTDHIDLWQIHNLSDMGQIDQIVAKGGAVEALVKVLDSRQSWNMRS